MGIGKHHPLGCNFVQVRRLDLRLLVKTAQISIAKIVGKDVYHVGLIGTQEERGCDKAQQN